MRSATAATAPGRMSVLFLSLFGFAQICSWGTLYYAFPQIAVSMGHEFGWPRSEVYGALTLGLLLSAFVAVPVDAAIDKGHGRSIMTGGSLLAAGMFVLWLQAQSLAAFYIAFAGIGLLHAAVLYSPAPGLFPGFKITRAVVRASGVSPGPERGLVPGTGTARRCKLLEH